MQAFTQKAVTDFDIYVSSVRASRIISIPTMGTIRMAITLNIRVTVKNVARRNSLVVLLLEGYGSIICAVVVTQGLTVVTKKINSDVNYKATRSNVFGDVILTTDMSYTITYMDFSRTSREKNTSKIEENN